MKAKSTNPALLKSFNERVIYFLHYIYESGGSEYIENDYYSDRSYSLAGCNDPDEFIRIMYALKNKQWITYNNLIETEEGGFAIYLGVRLTEVGIKEVEKVLPQIPLGGLVEQSIITGDTKVDQKINHAKKLFCSEQATMDDMRSACETLSFILEPIRSNLTPAITSADVNAFFELVNKFDIRHNKATVNRLEHPEQLEWVFYSLLNTINTYTKLKNRLSN
jgi:hypothetical protein